jgi:hypothetical protein
MKDAYEVLGPAIKYTDVIPLPRQYQHANQQPIQPHEIKDLSGVEKIELLVNGQFKYDHKISRIAYPRFPYFINRERDFQLNSSFKYSEYN